jgi:DNA polymerase I-like protein with 3'-5' exonuclease and polymerase domains|tara:strand:+ start:5614 stop:7479 length:1866 start_codon:yes stop_codon:yes gene_type:complete
MSFVYKPPTEWTPPDTFPTQLLKKAKEIAIDLETRDPNLKSLGPGYIRGDGEIVGVSIACEGFADYFPFAHESGFNFPKKRVLDFVRDVVSEQQDKVFHNASYDVGWLKNEGITVQGRIIDTMVVAPLIDENQFWYSLNALGRQYINEGKTEGELIQAAEEWGLDPKAEMWRLPSTYVGTYATQDAALTLKLWNRFKVLLEEQNLWNIFELEMNVLPIILDMKQRGVRVDVERAETLKKKLITREKKVLQAIKKESGVKEVQLWAANSLSKVFDALKLSYLRTPTGLPSFTKAFLENHSHPVAQLIREAREINKTHSTFIDSILKHEHNGRIHAEIRQLKGESGGTVTGRLSMSNPNLQQVPARNKEIGPLVRSLFLPEEGQKWCSADFSQQEPRILTHYASRSRYDGAETVADAYINGDADFHQEVANLVGIDRKTAKTIGLGIMYGMGKGKLADQLGVSVPEASDVLQKFNTYAPFVRQLADSVMRSANQKGYIKTILGRRCHFDMWEPLKYGTGRPLKYKEAVHEYNGEIKRAFVYKALNKLIQGSAADMTKQSMVHCYEAGHLPLLQVHDELVFSIDDKKDIENICKTMEEAVPLDVPNKVDAEVGKTWGDSMVAKN